MNDPSAVEQSLSDDEESANDEGSVSDEERFASDEPRLNLADEHWSWLKLWRTNIGGRTLVERKRGREEEREMVRERLRGKRSREAREV